MVVLLFDKSRLLLSERELAAELLPLDEAGEMLLDVEDALTLAFSFGKFNSGFEDTTLFHFRVRSCFFLNLESSALNLEVKPEDFDRDR